ncbi:MAG: BamA/TamA family outer membrane protein [Betaproteobacteria bacterium]|nr:BamA/TamA family outer membrane protein [Betaproteobacteria bacterium]
MKRAKILIRLAAAWACVGAGAALAQDSATATDFGALEAQGLIIRAIKINTGNVFDPNDPRERARVFGWVNALHIVTRPALIESALLFRAGEKISKQKIEETERLLRVKSTLHSVTIRAVNVMDGAADIEVHTQDAWSLSLGGSVSSTGGTRKTSVELTELNFLGTGARLAVASRRDSERKGTLVEAGYGKAFDGWTDVSILWSRFDDGSRRAASIVRPFYALDARWAAGAAADRNDRVDTLYQEGETAAEYRHESRTANVFGGVSRGLVQGWTTRWLAGVQIADHGYALEPGKAAPQALPADSRSRAPYVEVQWIEDRFVKLQNRNQIGRDEFLAMGVNARISLGYAMEGMGSSVAALVGGASIARGFAPGADQNLLASLQWDRRIGSTGSALDQYGAQFRWFVPQSRHWVFYAGGSALVVRGGGAADQFLLGGQNGLRGYPARYQTGNKRTLVSLEQRYYSDWYPWRVLRVGAAAFVDAGRAWGGDYQNRVNGGTLRDGGFGLRLAVDRAAFANVLHLDVAFPLDRAGDVKSRQFVVKTEVSF